MQRQIALMLILALVFTVVLHAQELNLQWSQSYGSGDAKISIDFWQKVVAVPGGGVIVAGRSDNHYVIAQYDESYSLLWHEFFDDDSLGNPYTSLDDNIGIDKLMLDVEGNIFLLDNRAVDDLRYSKIYKLSPSGQLLWVRNLYGPDDQGVRIMDIALDDAGFLYAAGGANFSMRDPWWPNELLSTHLAVKKFNPDGAEIWTGIFGSSDTTRRHANALHLGSNGDIFVTGLADSSCHTFKLNSSGELIWELSTNLFPNNRSEGFAITADSLENIFVTGGQEDLVNWGNAFLTIKIDNQGNMVWSNTENMWYSEAGPSEGKFIKVHTDGSIYAAGIEYSSWVGWGGSRVIKYSPDGDILWSTKGWATPENMLLDAQGAVYTVGTGVFAVGIRYSNVNKYSASGDTVWSTEFSGAGYSSYSNDICINDGASVHMVGSVYGDAAMKKLNTSDGEKSHEIRTNWRQGANEYMRSFFVDAAGKSYALSRSYNITGWFLESGGASETLNNYSSSGELLWQKDFSGSNYYPSTMVASQTEFVALAGMSDTSSNVLVVEQLLADGTHDWLYNSTSESRITVNDIRYDSEGNIFGLFSGDDKWTLVKLSAEGQEIWNISRTGNEVQMFIDDQGNSYVFTMMPSKSGRALIKYDRAGKQLWTYTEDLEDYDEVKDVVVDENGSVYTLGWNFIFSIYPLTVNKIDSVGNKLWSFTDTLDSYSAEPKSTKIDSSGSVFIMTDDGRKLRLTKLSSEGEELWTYQGYEKYSPKYLVLDQKGFPYVSLESTTQSPPGDLIAKFTPEGIPIWTSPSPVEDGSLSIALNDMNDFYVGGDVLGDQRVAAVFKFGNLNVTDTQEDRQGIRLFKLHNNYPNPFNPSTRIRFELPEEAETSLTVYDVRGHEIAHLVQGLRQAGSHVVQWEGVDRQGSRVSTGVYFARLQSGNYSKTIKMLYLK